MPVSPLLGPIVALVAWTLIVMVWMMLARYPVLKGREIPPGSRGADMPPGPHNWPGHNYNHLMEQPTLFYAIVLTLVLMGFDQPINVWLAWGYVAFRILHSLVQGTTNVVKVRFPIFCLATFCLVGLTVHAAIFFIHHGPLHHGLS